MTEIIKRDGSRQPYAPEKIVEAMKKSFRMREEPAAPEELQRLLESVEKRMAAVTGDWHVEDIQDAVERALMDRGHYDAAKRYILYRQRRTEFRAARTSLTEGTGAPELEGTLMKIQRDFPQERYPLTALCAKAVGFIKPGMETGAALDALVKAAVELTVQDAPDWEKIAARLMLFAFQRERTPDSFLRALMANYILEGVYFYSGFMFFYNLSRSGKMPGSAQEIRYINRDENTHLWLFRSILLELQAEEPGLFTPENVRMMKELLREGVNQEIAWGKYVIGEDIVGLTGKMVEDYILYLGNLRWSSLGFGTLYEGHEEEPADMAWVSQYANANMVKTDFFEAKSTAYAKSAALEDDL